MLAAGLYLASWRWRQLSLAASTSWRGAGRQWRQLAKMAESYFVSAGGWLAVASESGGGWRLAAASYWLAGCGRRRSVAAARWLSRGPAAITVASGWKHGVAKIMK